MGPPQRSASWRICAKSKSMITARAALPCCDRGGRDGERQRAWSRRACPSPTRDTLCSPNAPGA
eukprot:873386-Lingulodinium_polyedra.AAC.2